MTIDDQGLAPTQPGDTFVEESGGGARLVLPDAGYVLGDVIGRGGMGEVVRAEDKRIGRSVAVKRMRSSKPSADAIARFLREARIQARLDHPAIVPVHELGVDEHGRPYFTMKRLAGITLAETIAQRGERQRLLRAFVDVCLAIEFAHTRGVVHRDLKPSNIMLGDYGEVYVLDWGVARVLGDEAPQRMSSTDIDSLEEGTKTGDLLGTPGYMSPEQIRGQRVRTASDVYALGTILFEILAGEPLHPRGTAALASTLSAPQQPPAKRQPDVPPELDAACTAALAEEPDARPTARELADRVQRYLDGDRDHERRRQLAAEHLALARAALASGDPERRAEAMQAAGQALALDPASAEAARLVTGLIVEPPKELPAGLVREISEDERRVGVGRMKPAIFTMLAVMALFPLLPWMEVRSWAVVGEFYATLVLVTGTYWVLYRRGTPSAVANLVGTFLMAVVFTRVIGPWILTPIVILGSAFPITANPKINARRWVIVLWLFACLVTPLVLERIGVFAPSWRVTELGVISTSSMFVGSGPVDAFALVFTNVAILTAVVLFVRSANRYAIESRRRVLSQAWHLEQLLPAGRISVR